MINDELINNIPEYAKIIKDLEDKLDHIEKLIDLEWNGLITANRHWKFTPLKKYFGMTGNKETMLAKLQLLKETLDGGE